MQLPTRLPAIAAALAAIRRALFPGSVAYWERRYAGGGTSGQGSYGELALFKASVLNAFVAEYSIRSVIEFGCGDGNQLMLCRYPQYIGLDVSRSAIRRCLELFRNDPSKSFFWYDPDCFVDRARVFCADLVLSLDVLYHLVEDRIYDAYLRHLFAASDQWVVIYSTNEDRVSREPHVRHRRFADWVAHWRPDFRLYRTIPHTDGPGSSKAGFSIYKRTDITSSGETPEHPPRGDAPDWLGG